MPFDLLELLGLLVLGGIVAMDGTSFGQFMISRPLVAASFAGLIVGDAALGVTIGIVLEAFHLSVLPVGAAKYPEGGPAAVSAAAVYVTTDPGAVSLIIITIGALLLEYIGGETVHLMRLANGRLHGSGAIEADAVLLERRHRLSLLIDFARGVALVGGGIAFLMLLTGTLTPIWGIDEGVARVFVTMSVVAMIASSLRFLGSRIWLAAAGAAIGMVALYLIS